MSIHPCSLPGVKYKNYALSLRVSFFLFHHWWNQKQNLAQEIKLCQQRPLKTQIVPGLDEPNRNKEVHLKNTCILSVQS